MDNAKMFYTRKLEGLKLILAHIEAIDGVMSELIELEARHPQLQTADSPTQSVGGGKSETK